jgi:O-antigen biosynthesis protein
MAGVTQTEKSVLDVERFDPEQSDGRLIAAEHTARYRAAGALVAGKRVLDAGCGTGYGLAILEAAGAAHMTGVDLAPDAVELTRTRVPGAEVVQGSVHALPFDDDTFDVVVCFEVIEHVERQDEALAELARVLAPDGVLVLSSPNRAVYPEGNPHHVREYLPEELEAAVRRVLPQVRLYRQHVWLASGLLSPETARTGGDHLRVELLDPLEAGEETYTIAVASRKEPPALADDVALVDGFELKWWQDQLKITEQRADAQVASVERELAVAHATADELRANVREYGQKLLAFERTAAQLTEAHTQLQELQDERATVYTELERLRRLVTGFETSFSWRITRPLRSAKRRLKR